METAYSQNTAPLKAEIQKKGLIHNVKLEYLRVYAHDGLQSDNAILCHLVKAAVYIYIYHWNSSGLSLILLLVLTSFAPQGSEIIHFKYYLQSNQEANQLHRLFMSLAFYDSFMLWLPGHIDLADIGCCVFVKTFFMKTVLLNQMRPQSNLH